MAQVMVKPWRPVFCALRVWSKCESVRSRWVLQAPVPGSGSALSVHGDVQFLQEGFLHSTLCWRSCCQKGLFFVYVCLLILMATCGLAMWKNACLQVQNP